MRLRTLSLAALLILLTVLLRPDPGDSRSVVLGKKMLWTGQAGTAFAGDSRMWEGLSPVDAGPLPGRALNCAFPGGAYDARYLDYLGSLLDPGSQKRILVLGITPHSFTREALRKNGFLDYTHQAPWSLWADVRLGHLLRRFQPVSALEQRRLLGLDISAETMRIYHADGWAESWRLRPDTSGLAAAQELIYAHNPIVPQAEIQLFEQVSRWSQSGILVAGLALPASPEAEALERRYTGFSVADFGTAFVQAGGRWLEVEVPGLIFYDGVHLERESARTYSREVGNALRQLGGEP